MNTKDKMWIKSMNFCQKYCKCHQIPERSFFIKGYQIPLCARCTGIAIGQILAFFINPFIQFSWWIILFMIPLMVDGTVQYYTSYRSNNFKRIVTGIMYGFSFVSFFWGLIRFIWTLFWKVVRQATAFYAVVCFSIEFMRNLEYNNIIAMNREDFLYGKQYKTIFGEPERQDNRIVRYRQK